MSLDIETGAELQIEADVALNIEADVEVDVQTEILPEVEVQEGLEVDIQSEIRVEVEIQAPDVTEEAGLPDFQASGSLEADNNIEEPMVEVGGDSRYNENLDKPIDNATKKSIFFMLAILFTFCFTINFGLLIQRIILYESFKESTKNADFTRIIIHSIIFLSSW